MIIVQNKRTNVQRKGESCLFYEKKDKRFRKINIYNQDF